jgi:hypothetical protein
MTVEQAIAEAQKVLPGTPAPEGELDPRWQAIIKVGRFIKKDPEPVWAFALKWGRHANADLRMAIATCLLEHLLEYHFDLIFPRVEAAVKRSRRFADMFCSCWKFDQAEEPANARRMDQLQRRLGSKRP